MKNFKNILGAIALVLVCAFGMTSCGSKTIEDYVAEAQSKCPATIAEGVTMTEVNYDGEVYETVIEVTPELLAGFQMSAEQQQAQAIESTKAQYQVDPFTKLLVDNGVTMVIRYVSGEEDFVIELPAEELK